MRLELKNHNYELDFKILSYNEKEDLNEKLGIIPKNLNNNLSLYINNVLDYLNMKGVVLCLKLDTEEKGIVCLKFEHDKKNCIVKCIGVELTDNMNRTDLVFLVLKDVKVISDESDVDLLVHPLLKCFL